MSTTFIFTSALLCGVIIGLVTPMVVDYVRHIRIAVYRKDPAIEAEVLVKYTELEDLDLPGWLNDNPAPAKEW